MGTKGAQRVLDRELQRPGDHSPASSRWKTAAEVLLTSRGADQTPDHKVKSMAAEVVARLQGGRLLADGSGGATGAGLSGSGVASSSRSNPVEYTTSALHTKVDASHKKPFSVGKGVDHHGNPARIPPSPESITGMGGDPSSPSAATPYSIYTGKLRSLAGFAKGPREPLEKKNGTARRTNGVAEDERPTAKPHHHHIPGGRDPAGYHDANRSWEARSTSNDRAPQPRPTVVQLESSPYWTPGVGNFPPPVQVPSGARTPPAAKGPSRTPRSLTPEPDTSERQQPPGGECPEPPGGKADHSSHGPHSANEAAGAPSDAGTQAVQAPQGGATDSGEDSQGGPRPAAEPNSADGVPGSMQGPAQGGELSHDEQEDCGAQGLPAPAAAAGDRDGSASGKIFEATAAAEVPPVMDVQSEPSLLEGLQLPKSRFQDTSLSVGEMDEEDTHGEDEETGDGYGARVALNASLRGPSHEPTSPTLHRSEPLFLGVGSATGAISSGSAGLRQAVNQSFGLEGGGAGAGAAGGLFGRLKTSVGGGSVPGVSAPQIINASVANCNVAGASNNKGTVLSGDAFTAAAEAAPPAVAAEEDDGGSLRHRRASEAWTILIRQDGPGGGPGMWDVARSEPPLSRHLVNATAPVVAPTPAAAPAPPSQGVHSDTTAASDSNSGPASPRAHRSGHAPRRKSRDLQSLDIRNPRDMRMSLDIPSSPTSPWGGAMSPWGPPSSHGRHADQPFLDDMVNKPFARRVGGRSNHNKSGRKRPVKEKEGVAGSGSGSKDKGDKDRGGRDKRKDKGKDKGGGGLMEAIRAAREAGKGRRGLGVAVAVPAQVLKTVAVGVFSRIRLWPSGPDRVSTSHLMLLGDGRTVKTSWRNRVRSLFHGTPRRMSNDLDVGHANMGPSASNSNEFSNVERIGRLSMGGYGLSPGSGGAFTSMPSPEADGVPREGARSAWDSGPTSPASGGLPSSPTAHNLRRHAAPKARSRMALLLWHRAVRRIKAVNSVWSILVRTRMERMQPFTLVFYNSPQLEKKYKDTRMRYMMANLRKMVLLATLLLVISTISFLAMPPTDRGSCKPWWALVGFLYLFLAATYVTTTRMKQSLLQNGAARPHYWLVLALPALLSLVLGVGVMLLRDVGARRFLPLQSDIALALLALTFCQHLASQTAARILVVVAGFCALNLTVLIHPAVASLVEDGAAAGDAATDHDQDDGSIPRVAFFNLILALYSLTLLGAGYSREWDDRRSFILTSQVSASKVRSEALLENMLPRSILRALEGGRTLISEEFEEVSIMFIYIDGFNAYTASTPPKKLITFLNDVFSAIDNLCETREVYKIETVSDVYMVGGGVPDPCDDHAERVGLLALDLVKLATNWEVSERTGNLPLRLRIGVHCGPIVAGVIGLKRLHYRVFGDTVNMASRMGSHGAVGKVHTSEAFQDRLVGQKFGFKSRGVTHIKGKGPQTTYYLLNGPPGVAIGGTTSPLNDSFTSKAGSGDSVKAIRPADASPPLPIPVPVLESSIGRRMRFSDGDGFLGAAFTNSLRARQQQLDNGVDADGATSARLGPSPLQPPPSLSSSPPMYNTIHVPEHNLNEILAGLATASTHAFKGRGDLPRQLRLISSARCRPLIMDREDLVPGAADGLAVPVTDGSKPAQPAAPRPVRSLSGGRDSVTAGQASIIETLDDEPGACALDNAGDGTANPAVKRKPLGKTRLKVLRAVAAAPAPLMALRNDEVEAMCAAAMSPRRKDSDPGASSAATQEAAAAAGTRAPGQVPRRRRMSVSAALHGATTSDLLSSLRISEVGGKKDKGAPGGGGKLTENNSPTKKLARFKTMLQPRGLPSGGAEGGSRNGSLGASPELRPASGGTDGTISRGMSPMMWEGMGQPAGAALRGVHLQSYAATVDLEAVPEGGARRMTDSTDQGVRGGRDACSGNNEPSGGGQPTINPLLSSFGSTTAGSSVRSGAHLSASPSSERRAGDGLPGVAFLGSFHNVATPTYADASDVRSEASGSSWPAVWPEDTAAAAATALSHTISGSKRRGKDTRSGPEGAEGGARVRPGTASVSAPPHSPVVKRSSFTGPSGPASAHYQVGRAPSKHKGADALAMVGEGRAGVLDLLSPDHWWQAPQDGPAVVPVSDALRSSAKLTTAATMKVRFSHQESGQRPASAARKGSGSVLAWEGDEKGGEIGRKPSMELGPHSALAAAKLAAKSFISHESTNEAVSAHPFADVTLTTFLDQSTSGGDDDRSSNASSGYSDGGSSSDEEGDDLAFGVNDQRTQRQNSLMSRLTLTFWLHPAWEKRYRRENMGLAYRKVRFVYRAVLFLLLIYSAMDIRQRKGYHYIYWSYLLRMSYGLAVVIALSFVKTKAILLFEMVAVTASVGGLAVLATSYEATGTGPMSPAPVATIILALPATMLVMGLRFTAASATGLVILLLYFGQLVINFAILHPDQFERGPTVALCLFLLLQCVLLMGSCHSTELERRRKFLCDEEIRQQKAFTNRILCNLMPPTVASSLRRGERHIVDSYSEASVLYADIVGFTPLSAMLGPLKLVVFLNRLFSDFDVMCDKHSVTKINTIGDCYTCMAGVPLPDPDHCMAVVEMGLSMLLALDALQEELTAVFEGLPHVDMRVGVHTGSLIAGVVGIKNLRYDVWGETITITNKMESSGLPGRIHLSRPAYEQVKEAYRLEPAADGTDTFFLVV